MSFTENEVGQYAGLLTRYPLFLPGESATKEEVEEYCARLRWERRLLGRKYTVRKEGVEYFAPNSNDLKPATVVQKPGKDVQVAGVTLCSHHATGKKVFFAEFVNQFLLEIEEAVDTYLTEYNAAFYQWIEMSISSMAADEMAQDWGEVVEVGGIIKELFAGEAITIGDDDASAQTNCRACQISFLVSTPSLQSTLVHIANQCGSITLLAYLHDGVYRHIEHNQPNAYESATATKNHLTLLENLYRNPPDNLRGAYARGLTLPHIYPPRRFEDVGEGDSRAIPSSQSRGSGNGGKVAPRRIRILRMVRSTIGSWGLGKPGGYPGKGKAVLVE